MPYRPSRPDGILALKKTAHRDPVELPPRALDPVGGRCPRCVGGDVRAAVTRRSEAARGSRPGRRAAVPAGGAAARHWHLDHRFARVTSASVGRMPSARGTLDWSPAAAHPDLLAAPVAAAVRSLPAALVAPIDPTHADTAAFCTAYDVELGASANCVVVAARRGDVTTYAAVMVLATHRADVNGVVRRHLGARKISFAGRDDAVGRTGMEFGGITPVGLPDGWPVLVDEAVVAAGEVVIGSGLRRSKLLLTGTDLLGLPGAERLALAQPTG